MFAPRRVQRFAPTPEVISTWSSVAKHPYDDGSLLRPAPHAIRLNARMAAERKRRPWVLVLALMGALALGASGASVGWSRIVLYRSPIDPTVAGEGIVDPSERDAVVARTRAWLDALDEAKARGFPLSVAALVLGSATFVFAMRTLGGSRGARSILVQLVVAQAVFNAADYWLLRDVWKLNARVAWARQAAAAHEGGEPMVLGEDAPLLPILLGIQTFGSALVVIGLTRARSRRFLEARAEAVGEP